MSAVFLPHVGSDDHKRYGVARITRESRLIRDLTMPERDWSIYDPPTYLRAGSLRIPQGRWSLLPALLQRQAG